MQDDTFKSLLVRIRDVDDEESWATFVEIYEPFIEGHLRRRGISGELALDVRQEVLMVVSQRIADFEHNGRTGAFRNWLRTTTVNCLRTYARQQKRESPGGSVFFDVVQQLADDQSEMSRVWNHEYDRHVVQGLLVRLEPHFQENTLLAFRKTTLDQMAAADVATELGMTRNAVIVARCKVLRKLHELAGEFLD